MQTKDRKRPVVMAAVAVFVVASITAGAYVANRDDSTEPVAAAPDPAPAAAPTCSTATKAFIPTSVSIPGVGKKIPVLPLPADADGIPGTPPLTLTGKNSIAFDLTSGIRPGSSKGNVLLNAHTFPDGSAMGNKLLKGLQEGDQLEVKGLLGKVCYKVTERTEVLASKGSKRYYAKKGDPQVAIVVCSGERIGPGNWTKRTLWFASPVV